MFEIDPNYEALMNGVVFRHLRDSSKHNELASYSFDYSRWPDCKAKEVITFFCNYLPRGYEVARWNTLDRYKEFISQVSDKALPKSADVISDQLSYNLKKYWQEKFAREVAQYPERLDHLISEYQANKPSGVKSFSLNDELLGIVKHQVEAVESGDAMVTIPAFPLLSDYIGGFNDSRVTLFTALTGLGKTNFAISLAQSASEVMDVEFFNMEMTKHEFASRFVLNGAGIDSKDWRTGKFAADEFAQRRIFDFAEKRKEKNEIRFTDGKALTMDEIRASVFSMFDGTKRGLVIIDYDQKIILKNKKDEWAELLDAMGELEEIAKRTKTHIFVLSQAGEDGRSKASKRMEQPATNVLNFYRQKHPFIPSSYQYFIKGIKTRYSDEKVIEMGVDLAKSKVWEIGLTDAPTAKAKGRHDL